MPKIEKDLLKVKGTDGQWRYVPAVGGSADTSPTWDSVQNKPFSTLGSGLAVDENGVLSAHVAEWKKVIIKDEDVYQDINTVDTLKVNLEDKTEYRIIKIYKLTLMCPDTDYECWMRITTPHNGMPIITFPEQISFIGKKPEFGMDQVWEISIKDGVMIAQKVGDGT